MVKLVYNGTKTDFGLPMEQKLGWVQSFVELVQ